jgi:hypothetical protein
MAKQPTVGRCSGCGMVKPIVRDQSGLRPYHGSLTRGRRITVLWCQDCWDAEEARFQAEALRQRAELAAHAATLGITI